MIDLNRSYELVIADLRRAIEEHQGRCRLWVYADRTAETDGPGLTPARAMRKRAECVDVDVDLRAEGEDYMHEVNADVLAALKALDLEELEQL